MYEKFASVYDQLMGDIPYDRFVGLWEEMLAATGLATDKLIDMGCGTGKMVPQFLRRARMVIGVDPSPEMLAQAAQKVAAYGPRVSFIQARAEQFQAPVRADGCVAFCDVLSYTRDHEELARSLRAVARSLKSGGWMLFDLHSPNKITQIIGENLYGDVRDDEIAIMKTEIDPARMQVTYDLVLMLRESDGRYARFDEQHIQRAYDLEAVLRAIAEAGFERVAVGADFQIWWGDAKESGAPQTPEVQALSISAGLRIVGRPDLEVLAHAQRWFFFAQLP